MPSRGAGQRQTRSRQKGRLGAGTALTRILSFRPLATTAVLCCIGIMADGAAGAGAGAATPAAPSIPADGQTIVREGQVAKGASRARTLSAKPKVDVEDVARL